MYGAGRAAARTNLLRPVRAWPPVKIAFGSITWTPLLPSTSSVMSTSPATLISM
jgi:hypothetical protein